MGEQTTPQTTPQTIRLVIGCITFLATLFAILGAILLYKGYQSGELFVGGGLTAAGTLGAMLSSTRSTPAPSTNGKTDTMQTSTVTTTTTPTAAPVLTDPVPVVIQQPDSQPVPVTNQPDHNNLV